jgi:hypothetical protein
VLKWATATSIDIISIPLSIIFLWNIRGSADGCITLRIIAFLNFVHRPEFKITIEHNVLEAGSVSIFR